MSDSQEVFGRVSNDPTMFLFRCLGCGFGHHANVGPGGWKWNGDLVKPTLKPSLLVNRSIPGGRCHFFVTNGQLRYLNDCEHELAGQTVDMVPWSWDD